MKLRFILRTGWALAVVVAVFAPSAAAACETEEYDYETTRFASTVEPGPSTRLATGVPVTYNYTEIVNQSERRSTLPAGGDIVPGSVEKYYYYWQEWVPDPKWEIVSYNREWRSNMQYEIVRYDPAYGWVDRGSWVWSSNMQWEVVGYQRVSQGYMDIYWEAVPYSYDYGHTAYGFHRNWYSWGTDGCADHWDSPDGMCTGHAPAVFYGHENRRPFWHSYIVSGYWYEQRQRWVDTSYDQAVYGWVDRGSWVWSSNMQWEVVGSQPVYGWVDRGSWVDVPVYGWVDRGSWVNREGAVAPAPSATIAPPYAFDVRWQIYVPRQRMADPRTAGVPYATGTLTFNYTEILAGCTNPT